MVFLTPSPLNDGGTLVRRMPTGHHLTGDFEETVSPMQPNVRSNRANTRALSRGDGVFVPAEKLREALWCCWP